MSKPDALSQALIGLMVLAQRVSTSEDLHRLADQFRRTYPEIWLMDKKHRQAILSLHRAARLTLRQSEMAGSETCLSARANEALSEAVAAMEAEVV